MLRSLVGYVRGAGLDMRWVVMEGDPEFFRVTKRLHNRLHSALDPQPLGPAERAAYEPLCPQRRGAGRPDPLGRRHRDSALHDPQTAGMIPRLLELGAPGIWRAHIGLDLPNEAAREAWRFLLAVR